MRTREKLRTFADLFAITILWAAILFLAVMGTAFGDCFELGCGEAKDRTARIAIAVVAVGFIAHIAGYIWMKIRRARRG
jgi:hypothetical protein